MNLHPEQAEMIDTGSTLAIFHCGPEQDRSAALQGVLSRGVRARKRANQVQVRFAEQVSAVDTLEGIVHAKLGDAIVTGLIGELWPIPRASFAARYQAVPPLDMGAPGLYLSLPIDVVAVRMQAPFGVLLADGHSRLTGQAGDWLIDYGDGNLGIVAASIFDATYEILGQADMESD